MSTQNGASFTKDTVTIVSGGRVGQVSRGQGHFTEVINALKRGDYSAAFNAIDRATQVVKRSFGAFSVSDGVVKRNGVAVHNVITNRILQFIDSGLPFKGLLAFLENLLGNPSKRAIDEGYLFLEHENMPITEDGCFLAYKSISSDWLSKASGSEDVEVSRDDGRTWKVHRGRIPNFVGSIVRMKRNLVDDDKDRHCSNGLHVGALGYAGPNGWYHSGSDHVVIVKVNPRDIVSVPTDHSSQKLRVCQYEVVSEFQGAMTEPLFTAKATPFSQKPSSFKFRCRDCRNRKKRSTFESSGYGQPKCPRCNGRRTYQLR